MTENHWNFSIDSSESEPVFVHVERSNGLLSFAIHQRIQRHNQPTTRILAEVGGEAEDAVGLAACLVVAAGEHPSDAQPEVDFKERVAELRAAAVAAMPPAMRGKIPAPMITKVAEVLETATTTTAKPSDGELPKLDLKPEEREFLIAHAREWLRASAHHVYVGEDGPRRQAEERDRIGNVALRTLCRHLGADPDMTGA